MSSSPLDSTAESLTFFLFPSLFVGQSKQAPGGSLTCRPGGPGGGRAMQTARLSHLRKHSVVSGPPPTDLIRPQLPPPPENPPWGKQVATSQMMHRPSIPPGGAVGHRASYGVKGRGRKQLSRVCVFCEYTDYQRVRERNTSEEGACAAATHTRKNKRVSERVFQPVVY